MLHIRSTHRAMMPEACWLNRILDPRQPGSDAGSKTAFEDESNNPFARREAGPNQSLANKDDVVEQQQFSGTTAR